MNSGVQLALPGEITVLRKQKIHLRFMAPYCMTRKWQFEPYFFQAVSSFNLTFRLVTLLMSFGYKNSPNACCPKKNAKKKITLTGDLDLQIWISPSSICAFILEVKCSPTLFGQLAHGKHLCGNNRYADIKDGAPCI